MSEIQKSLRILGLDPGSSKDMVQRRYKRLIMVWHPDRFPTTEGKLDAEEELKKINNAKDILFNHFDQGHKPTGCECQSEPGAASSGSSNKTAGTGPAGGQSDAEAEARRRDQERRRRASEARDEYARKEKETQSQAGGSSSTTGHSGLEEAQKQQAALKDNSLRWKVAIAEAVIFFGVLIFAGTGYGLKSWWHDMSWKWERDHAPQQEPTPSPQPSYQAPPTTERDYSQNTEPPPNYNSTPLIPNGVAKPFDNSNVPVPIYNAPSTSTSPNGFNWKASPYEAPSSSSNPLAPATPTTTTTGAESAIDTWSKLKTVPFNPPATPAKPSQVDLDKYLKP
jgi:curved DNA-binding protein CbpA